MHASTLIGDVGGTNVRFALTGGNAAYGAVRAYPCDAFDSLEAAIRQYLADTGAAAPGRVRLAVAGPTNSSEITVTNRNWRFSRAGIRQSSGAASVDFINDFEAVALCLPALDAADTLRIGEPPHPDLSAADLRLGVLGPGTGLGAAVLTAADGRRYASATEGGHVAFAPETEQQERLLARLRQRFGRVSAERLLSGTGLANLYWALGDSDASTNGPDAAEVFQSLEQDPRAADSVALFFECLGQVAGDYALACGAFDGIYIAGGIVPRYAEQFLRSGFRRGFENKGRFSALLHKVPTLLITHPHPGLLGLAASTG